MGRGGEGSLVLVVDDDLDVRETMVDVLRGCAHEVMTVDDGVGAWTVLQRVGARPCVIITDLEMPVMNGYELITAVRADKKFHQVRIVVLSALGGITPGADENVRKPFEVESLRRTVRRLLDPR
jgi:chemosensory pili system protein ChpA (sensor histidine kinase/response regulator)